MTDRDVLRVIAEERGRSRPGEMRLADRVVVRRC